MQFSYMLSFELFQFFCMLSIWLYVCTCWMDQFAFKFQDHQPTGTTKKKLRLGITKKFNQHLSWIRVMNFHQFTVQKELKRLLERERFQMEIKRKHGKDGLELNRICPLKSEFLSFFKDVSENGIVSRKKRHPSTNS